MKPQCVFTVRYILPAIRVLMAENLVEDHSLIKVEAAEKLKLTPAAITHYLKEDRGTKFIETIKKSEKIMKLISEHADAIAKNAYSEDDINNKMCEVCLCIRSEGLYKTLLENHKKR